MVWQAPIQPMVITINSSNKPTITPTTIGTTIVKGMVCTVTFSNLSEQGDGYALGITCTVVSNFVEWIVIVIGVHIDFVVVA